MRTLQFLAIVLTALALVPGGAHLFALPNKIRLVEVDYFVTQNVYRGWALFGIVLFGAMFANLALTVAVRRQRAFIFVLINLACLIVTLVIFFAFRFLPIRPPTTGRRSRPTGSSCVGNGRSHTR